MDYPALTSRAPTDREGETTSGIHPGKVPIHAIHCASVQQCQNSGAEIPPSAAGSISVPIQFSSPASNDPAAPGLLVVPETPVFRHIPAFAPVHELQCHKPLP